MAEITRQQVIDALDIPTQEEIKAAIKLPTQNMIINRMFKTTMTDDYMVDALNVPQCVDNMILKFGDLITYRDDIIQTIKDELPTPSDIKSNFRDHEPLKNEITEKLVIPKPEDLTSGLTFPVRCDQLISILSWLSNKETFCTKYDLVTKDTILQTLDDIYEECPDEEKQKILRLKTIVPDIITEDDIKIIIPLGEKQQQLLDKLHESISIPVSALIKDMSFYDRDDIIRQIVNDDLTLENLTDSLPDIPCKEVILDLFRNVALDEQPIFEKLGVSTFEETCEILDIDKIIDTYELPSDEDMLASLNLPDQMTAINAVQDSMPLASDFITSLHLPTPLDLCKALTDKVYMTPDMLSDIADILAHDIVTNVGAIQFNMKLLNKVDVINDLINLDGRLPPTNEIRAAVPIATYSEMAAKLDFVQSNVMVQSIRQYISNQFNIESMGDDVEDSADLVNKMIESINPKTIMSEIGEEKYKMIESKFKDSEKSSNDFTQFLTKGW